MKKYRYRNGKFVMSQTTQFNEILEMIDCLSPDEQEDLVNIVRQRRVEQRRDEIATNITKAQQDYKQGNLFRGGVEEVITELNDCFSV